MLGALIKRKSKIKYIHPEKISYIFAKKFSQSLGQILTKRKGSPYSQINTDQAVK